MSSDEAEIVRVLEEWAATTRRGELDAVLAHHERDALIYDVLPPMKYEGVAAYRASWGDWQPETPEDGRFDLQDLVVTAGVDVAFAHGFILCGGTTPAGKEFSDLVRATFCLRKRDGGWKVAHQHISKPLEMKG